MNSSASLLRKSSSVTRSYSSRISSTCVAWMPARTSFSSVTLNPPSGKSSLKLVKLRREAKGLSIPDR
ncbi:hypothetical protein D3C71_1996790 [compost metagenome]